MLIKIVSAKFHLNVSIFALCRRALLPSIRKQLLPQDRGVFKAHMSPALEQGRLSIGHLAPMIHEDTRLLDPTLFVTVESHTPVVFAVDQPALSHRIDASTYVLAAQAEGCQQASGRSNQGSNNRSNNSYMQHPPKKLQAHQEPLQTLDIAVRIILT